MKQPNRHPQKVEREREELARKGPQGATKKVTGGRWTAAAMTQAG
jgi:hypothetical protein